MDVELLQQMIAELRELLSQANLARAQLGARLVLAEKRIKELEAPSGV